MYRKLIFFLMFSGLFLFSCQERKERNKLINELKKSGYTEKEIAVTFNTFFSGDLNYRSIAANAIPAIQPDTFYRYLKRLKADPRTTQIYVRIADVEGITVYSDAIYIVGNWDNKSLQKALSPLHPNKLTAGWLYGQPANVKETTENVFTAWWN